MDKFLEFWVKFVEIIKQLLALFGYGSPDENSTVTTETTTTARP